MENFLYTYYIQYPGHFSAIIFNKFTEENVSNNMDTECVIRHGRQFVLPDISKHCLPAVDKYIDAYYIDYMRDFHILLPLSRIGAAKKIENDEKAMALYAGYKGMKRDVSEREGNITIKLNKMISQISNLLANKDISDVNINRNNKWTTPNILDSLEEFSYLWCEHTIFRNCKKESSKKSKINAMKKGIQFSQDKKDLECIESWLDYGININNKEEARKFAFSMEELLCDDDDD
eukprot:7024_1